MDKNVQIVIDGIIIGIGSVIGIVMVGDSMTNSMTSSLQEMGANTVQISLQQRESENGTSYSVYMDEEDYINEDEPEPEEETEETK